MVGNRLNNPVFSEVKGVIGRVGGFDKSVAQDAIRVVQDQVLHGLKYRNINNVTFCWLW